MSESDEEFANVAEWLTMTGYSLLLMMALVLGSPWWLARMFFSARGGARYREGLWARLGRVPAELRTAVAGQRVVWVHAVSVGEVLAATRLVAELGEELGAGWSIVVSTTTATGQALARERFGAERVFYYPLDFAWAVRAYLRALQPELVVLMESEIWPRMLVECGRRGVPVAVVNARVSDRSYARGLKVRAVWGRVLRRVDLFLAQSEEDATRLVGMGARAKRVKAIGNLKYDVRAAKASRIAELIQEAAGARPIVVAGSTVDRLKDTTLSEDEIVMQAWQGALRMKMGAMLVLAPRHPERFAEVGSQAMKFECRLASEWAAERGGNPPIAKDAMDGAPAMVDGVKRIEIVVLDTIGDLAAVYGVADVAFVGGSLVKRGGHNPLEPAQFGVPVVMGPSYENFRDVVGKMIDADGISIVGQTLRKTAGLSTASAKSADSGRDDSPTLQEELEAELVRLLTDRDAARAMGERGRAVFEAQSGATGRAVVALAGLVKRSDETVQRPGEAVQ